jgi:hypothetical protein
MCQHRSHLRRAQAHLIEEVIRSDCITVPHFDQQHPFVVQQRRFWLIIIVGCTWCATSWTRYLGGIVTGIVTANAESEGA